MGFYGIDFTTIFTDNDFDSVIIAGGNSETEVDFTLYDSIAISGRIFYSGSLYSGSLHQYTCYIGLFAASIFDTTGGPPDPDNGDETHFSSYPEYSFHEFDGLPEDAYYVGSYLDVNYNQEYDPAVDPAGFYTVGENWAFVTVQDGEDAVGVNIYLDDPAGGPPPLRSGQLWVPGSEKRPAGHPALKRMLGLTTRLLDGEGTSARQRSTFFARGPASIWRPGLTFSGRL